MDREKFWSKIDIRNNDECWSWQGYISPFGYGLFYVDGQFKLAHRLTWMLVYGQITKPCVLHKCDNRPCCNPAHLFLGTRTDNHKDMMHKGRNKPAPIKNKYRAVLTDEQVKAIRQDYRPRVVSQRALAHKYGVTQANIYYILAGKTWS